MQRGINSFYNLNIKVNYYRLDMNFRPIWDDVKKKLNKKTSL